jgi:2-polyprenyl-3-methyl-5-hydroxy-6-metoxy-1,4-benzoquinol methylase
VKITEEQIRPNELFNRYLALAADDAHWISTTSNFETVKCWACDETLNFSFEKCGFKFGECPSCRSIINDPRPLAKDISRFYSEGKSPRFWASDFYRTTAESRRELLWRTKAKRVAQIINSQPVRPDWICDIGAGFGIFAEELRREIPEIQIIAVEPTPSLADELRAKGITTIPKFLGDVRKTDLPHGVGFLTSFELLEHLHNPLEFLKDVSTLTSTGSAFLATTLSSWGLDIQLLGKESKAIFPPHHLQIISPKAIRGLCSKAGFTKVEISTPGKLDLDIAKKSVHLVQDRFWHLFLSEGTDSSIERMQEVIAETGFSSHMWCLFQK